MLGHTYRVQAKNETGQTISTGNVNCFSRRWKRATDGTLTWDTEATLLTTGGTLANNAVASGTTQDNSTDEWEGASLYFDVTAPASASGNVTFFLQRSTDGGTDWPDDGTGTVVMVINFTTSGQKKRSCQV